MAASTYYYPYNYGLQSAGGYNGESPYIGTAQQTGGYIEIVYDPSNPYTTTVTFNYDNPSQTSVTETLTQTPYTSASYNETSDGTYDYLLSNSPVQVGTSYTFTGGSFVLNPAFETNPVCFVSGTLIRTVNGDVRVEALKVGDLVVAADGEHHPIRWIGHRTIVRPTFEQFPVRILAGAFGGDLPERDLYLSPGHPVLVGANPDNTGGHLVPIMCLINGTTIERAPIDKVTYWHVELNEHDILLAEGLPAESYLDWGDRPFFSEACDHALQNPDFIVPGLWGRCRPVAIEGPLVEAERCRLDALLAMKLTAQCGWPSPHEIFAGLDRA